MKFPEFESIVDNAANAAGKVAGEGVKQAKGAAAKIDSAVAETKTKLDNAVSNATKEVGSQVSKATNDLEKKVEAGVKEAKKEGSKME